MKNLQDYIYKLNKVYEYRVKIAGVKPEGDILERIKNAANMFDVESITNARSIPIQEHRDFPKLGPCEAWVFEVSVKYPTTSALLRQVIKERANINPDCICVYTKDEDDNVVTAESVGKDVKGARLDQLELDSTTGQELVGKARSDSLMKELTKATPAGLSSRKTSANFSTDTIGDTASPVGSKQNKIPNPYKGQNK